MKRLRGVVFSLTAAMVLMIPGYAGGSQPPGGQGADGLNVEVSAKGKPLAKLLYFPSMATDSTQTYTIIPVPRASNARTLEGELISGLKLSAKLEGDAVRIVITSMVGELENMSAPDKEKKIEEPVVASYLLHSGEGINIPETKQFGLDALDVKVTSISSIQAPPIVGLAKKR